MKATTKIQKKRLYVWQLASFLRQYGMTMSGEELAAHLNRNRFFAGTGERYRGGRGTYTLIRETWKWVQNELELPEEAKKVADAFVKPDGTYAYK